MNSLLETIVTLVIAMAPVIFIVWVFSYIPCFPPGPDAHWYSRFLYWAFQPSARKRIAYVERKLSEAERKRKVKI